MINILAAISLIHHGWRSSDQHSKKWEAGNQVNNSSAPLANFREGAHQIWRQSSKINASSYALMMIQRTANLTV
jgi:hypothetical protein